MFKKIISGVLAGITVVSITIFPSFSEGNVEKSDILAFEKFGLYHFSPLPLQ
jgi:hypothetical protein